MLGNSKLTKITNPDVPFGRGEVFFPNAKNNRNVRKEIAKSAKKNQFSPLLASLAAYLALVAG